MTKKEKKKKLTSGKTRKTTLLLYYTPQPGYKSQRFADGELNACTSRGCLCGIRLQNREDDRYPVK